MSTMPIVEAAKLLDYPSLMDKVFEWNPALRTAYAGSSVPWPIVFLLSCFNKKHIFVSRMLPKPDIFRDKIRDFIRRLKWRYVLRDVQSTSFVYEPRVKSTADCVKAVPFPHYLDALQTTLMQAFMKARYQARFSDRSYCNISPVTALAFRLLQSNGLKAIPVDKGHGFVVIRRADATDAHLTYLGGSSYREVYPFEVFLDRTVHEGMALTLQIQQLEAQPGLAAKLNKPFYAGGSTVASFQTTIKVHKPQGQVTARPLHASNRFLLDGIAGWVVVQIRVILAASSPWLLRDSFDLIHRLEGADYGDGCKCIHLDVKDFFMSGDINALASDIMILFPQCARTDLVRECVSYLLSNQFVRLPDAPGRCWKVVSGTGMGLLQSGDFADLAFRSKAETWACDPITLHALDIRAYFRFKDDILLVRGSFAKGEQFVRGLRRRADYFVVNVEEVGTKVHFLDLYVDVAGGRPVTTLALKETTMVIPLAVQSCHPPACHWSWPAAVERRCRTLSRNSPALSVVLDEIRARFIRSSRPFSGPQVDSRRGTRVPPDEACWIGLPYHPAVYHAVNSALHGFNVNWRPYIAANWKPITVRPAWTNVLRPLHVRVRGRKEGDVVDNRHHPYS